MSLVISGRDLEERAVHKVRNMERLATGKPVQAAISIRQELTTITSPAGGEIMMFRSRHPDPLVANAALL
jgi:hypothetical protein